MSGADSTNSENKLAMSSEDAKKGGHSKDSWSSWMECRQNVGSSSEVEAPLNQLPPMQVDSLANDGPAPLQTSSAAFSQSTLVTNDSLQLSIGALVISDPCLNNISLSSDDGKKEEQQQQQAQVLSLVDSVNTSDDIKSCVSTIGSRGASVHRASGAVSKKSQNTGLTHKGSRTGAVDKGLKINARSASPHKGEIDEAISPPSSAPPPPPPTPNVVSCDSSQDHNFLSGVSPSQVPFSTARRSGSLTSWPPSSSMPSSVKRPSPGSSSVNSSTLQPKESATRSNLFNLFTNANKSDQDDYNDSDTLLTTSPIRHCSYGVAGHHNLYEEPDEIDPSAIGITTSKPIPVERCSSSAIRTNNPSPNTGVVVSAGVGTATSYGPNSSGGTSMSHGGSRHCHCTSTASASGARSISPTNGSASPSNSSSIAVCSCVHHSSSSSASVASCSSSSAPCPSVTPAAAGGGQAVGAAAGSSVSLVIRPSTSDRQSNAAAVAGGEQEAALHQRAPVHNAKAGPMYNWQATLTTVKERFAFLFNNEILSDVQFVVGRGEEEQNIPAHKFVLAVGSAVFDAMFNGQLASQQQVIHLPDVEPQAFLSLLSFLYSDEVQIGPETVMTVLYTAKKYAVPALERRCVDFLKTNLSSDNAFMLLTQARLFDEPQLAALCLKTIDKCTGEAIVAEGFTDIDHDTLTLVLQRDTLRIKELHLFQAVCRWAEAECHRQGCGVSGRQQRAVLGMALKLIRFPLMTVEEFAQGPAQSNILTDAEVVQLFLYFSVNPKPSVDFIDVPRCCMTGKEQTMCRFQSIEARWGYSGTPDRIRFIVDRRIFVVGFGMYGSIHGPSEYEVIVQLIHTLTGKVCGSNETVFTSDGTVNTFRVMFPDPIEVLPNTNYTAYATLKGPDSHYGTKGLRRVVVECPSGDRVCFQFSYAAGNNNGTSVEDGQIPEIIFYT